MQAAVTLKWLNIQNVTQTILFCTHKKLYKTIWKYNGSILLRNATDIQVTTAHKMCSQNSIFY